MFSEPWEHARRTQDTHASEQEIKIPDTDFRMFGLFVEVQGE